MADVVVVTVKVAFPDGVVEPRDMDTVAKLIEEEGFHFGRRNMTTGRHRLAARSVDVMLERDN